MEFDFNTFATSPLTVDLLHIILAGVVVVLAVLWVIARAKLKAALSTGRAAAAAASVEPVAEPEAQPKDVGKLQSANPDSALQLLSLLQNEGRFLDFLQEDLGGFSDEEIGAVARVVHEGSKKTLVNYFAIAPLRSEEEETRITIAEGFDPSSVRLTGNVVGQAPFTGTLVHRGWQAREVRLPRVTEGHNTTILAPAEVELS